MTKETKRIDFDEFAAHLPMFFEELAREKEPVLVEKEGQLFRVEAATTAHLRGMHPHDPERVRRMLRKTTGAFKGVNPKELMKDIHASRQQASRGRPA